MKLGAVVTSALFSLGCSGSPASGPTTKTVASPTSVPSAIGGEYPLELRGCANAPRDAKSRAMYRVMCDEANGEACASLAFVLYFRGSVRA